MDVGVILVCVIFSISGLSCIIGLGCYIKEKIKKNKLRKQFDNEYYNL
jgi:hypothetical protein